jgi:hypothetical protein
VERCNDLQDPGKRAREKCALRLIKLSIYLNGLSNPALIEMSPTAQGRRERRPNPAKEVFRGRDLAVQLLKGVAHRLQDSFLGIHDGAIQIPEDGELTVAG